jgi:hypothetical protein
MNLKMSSAPLIIALTITSLSDLFAVEPDSDGILPYADTEWRSMHAGPTNAKFVPIDIGSSFQLAWTALEGEATPVAPAIGPEGNIYQTTGLGPGNSNLTALDQEGNILWQTKAWVDASDFDSGAIIQTPIIDDDGYLYVADCNQFWAFHSDGTVKWVSDLPEAPSGTPFQDGIPRNPPVTAFFMNDGAVGAATFFGQVAFTVQVSAASRGCTAEARICDG